MSPSAQIDALSDGRRWSSRLIEAAWLASVLHVPLIFAPPGWLAFFETPKVALIRLAAGGIVALWAVDLALGVWVAGGGAYRDWRDRAWRWLREEPVRWTLVAAALYLAVVVLSTLASAVPRIAGVRLLELGMPERALIMFERALALSHEGVQTAEGLALQGVASRDMGRLDDARRLFEEALASASGPGPRAGRARDAGGP